MSDLGVPRTPSHAEEMTGPLASDRGVHEFSVMVAGCSRRDTQRVLAELLAFDEDYGFDYQISRQLTDLEHAGDATFGTCAQCTDSLVCLIAGLCRQSRTRADLNLRFPLGGSQ